MLRLSLPLCHRLSAMVLGIFILLHLTNHALIFAGAQVHIDAMNTLRGIYQHPVVEWPLLFFCGFQIISGLVLVYIRRGQRRSMLDRAQALSGVYMAFFLSNHLVAVLYGRIALELDTNLYFGIAGIHSSPYFLFFIPYYFLAVLAIFIHISAAVHWLLRNRFERVIRNRISMTMIAAGGIFATLLLLAFAGVNQDISIPEEYLAPYTQAPTQT